MTTSTKDDRVHPYHARAFVKRLLDIGADQTVYYENIEGGHARRGRQQAARAFMMPLWPLDKTVGVRSARRSASRRAQGAAPQHKPRAQSRGRDVPLLRRLHSSAPALARASCSPPQAKKLICSRRRAPCTSRGRACDGDPGLFGFACRSIESSSRRRSRTPGSCIAVAALLLGCFVAFVRGKLALARAGGRSPLVVAGAPPSSAARAGEARRSGALVSADAIAAAFAAVGRGFALVHPSGRRTSLASLCRPARMAKRRRYRRAAREGVEVKVAGAAAERAILAARRRRLVPLVAGVRERAGACAGVRLPDAMAPVAAAARPDAASRRADRRPGATAAFVAPSARRRDAPHGARPARARRSVLPTRRAGLAACRRRARRAARRRGTSREARARARGRPLKCAPRRARRPSRRAVARASSAASSARSRASPAMARFARSAIAPGWSQCSAARAPSPNMARVRPGAAPSSGCKSCAVTRGWSWSWSGRCRCGAAARPRARRRAAAVARPSRGRPSRGNNVSKSSLPTARIGRCGRR